KREAQIAFYDEDVRSAAAEAAKELVAEALAKAAQEAAAKAQEAARNRDIEIARNLKAIGIPIEQISRVTGLSNEEAQKI
ncbi:MAG: hypothetical protein LBG73_07130, partial [Spirochaetaceae bacterium]|nr:hypothetical protein [Spirochaetaceae bacterium]